MKIIGTCSICNGPVGIPENWSCLTPPTPKCSKCGSECENKYGPKIPMKKQKTVYEKIEEDIFINRILPIRVFGNLK